MRASILLPLLISFVTHSVNAQESLTKLSLRDVVQKSLQNSKRLSAVRSEREAANYKSNSQYSFFFPRLSLDATGRYVTEIPSLQVSPRQSLPFGDNQSYSVGPVLTWTLWDSGATHQSWQSLQAIENQKVQEINNTKIQIELSAQLAYFRVILASAQMNSVAEALELTQAQYKDIQSKQQSGASSKADALSAHSEVLNLESKYLQAQSDLTQALLELFSMTGESENFDLSHPVNAQMRARPLGKPTLIVEIDPIDKTFLEFNEQTLLAARPSPNHPQIAAFTYQSDAFFKAAKSASSGHWPKLQVFAKSSLDYPNGPNLEQIHQNSFGVTLTWSIFEAGRISNDVKEKQSLAQASDYKKEQAQIDLTRDWQKALQSLALLRSQQEVHRVATEESQTIAKLVYSSYKAGKANFLEVQSANLRALDSKIQSAKTEVQILMQLAVLSNLVEEKSQ